MTNARDRIENRRSHRPSVKVPPRDMEAGDRPPLPDSEPPPNPHPDDGPKYLKLERKDTRLRSDQLRALTELARKLQRQKKGQGGERITENTLIRVAVDLLLEREESLSGKTERELRESVGL